MEVVVPDTTDNQIVKQLANGSLHRFADWPNPEVRRVAVGIYSIWRNEEFVYVGIAGRNSEEKLLAAKPKSKLCGLADRLRSHAHGRRSGDQFCVYVADRLVLPALTKDDIDGIASGRLSFDALVRSYIHQHLSYRYFTFDGLTKQEQESARRLEQRIQSGDTPLGQPYAPLAANRGRA
jgi:hypothetical protein